MQDFLEMRKYTYERLDGSIRAEERFAAIRNFSIKSNANINTPQSTPFVFLISTRAGGVGLNLVAADTVSLVLVSKNSCLLTLNFSCKVTIKSTLDNVLLRF